MAKITSYTYTIRIGDDFRQKLTLKDKETGNPLNLSGYSFKMEIRECKSNLDPILTLESPIGISGIGIEIDDAINGNIFLIISKNITKDLTDTNAVYDLKWTTDVGQVTTILEGNIQILETVTK